MRRTRFLQLFACCNNNKPMRNMNSPSLRPTLRGLVLALAVTALSSQVARAVPYASGVTKSGSTVSFILNQNAQGLVVLRDGANPVYPGTAAGPLSFDMTGYTSYQIIVTGNTAKAWSQYIPDGTDRNFEYAFGVSINKNPASTNFGKVYVSQSRDGTTGAGRFTKSGVFVVRADGVAEGGVMTGGVDWTAAGSSSPFKSTIGPDNHLYVSDFSNDRAYEFNDDLSVATRVIDDSNKTDVGLTTSQYVESLWVEGTQAGGDRVIYTLDSNYYDNARKGLIRYDLGANAAATAGDTGTEIIGPTYYTFYPRDVARDSNGNWYLNQYRATAGQAPAISKFDGSLSPPINTAVWETGNTYTYTYGLGLNEAGGTVAVGSSYDGTVWFFDMATGAFVESFGAGSAVRDEAFDVAGNMVTVDNFTEYARFWSPGGYTVATTRSDGTFALTKPSVNVSVTATTGTTSMDFSQPPGVFTFTRTGDTGVALPVGYTLTGTATNGAQYQLLSGTATFQAGSSSTDVLVTAKPYSPAGPTRSVTLTINNSNTYSPTAPASATVWIVDTNKPSIHIAVRDTQFYERTNDLARFTLTRWGDTNTYLSQVNVTYAGTAIEGTHYYGDTYATMSYGDETKDVFVHPICDGVLTGPMTVTATVAAAGDDSYTVGTPATSGAVTRVDADDLPETVLFADNFDTDSSANWTVRFASRNGIEDYTTRWAFDYSTEAIPPAPHSKFTSSTGLKMTVNKNEPTAGGAAGLNLYPKGKSFSGNYALRFDMYLKVGSAASTTEYALCGINHSGNQTIWLRGPSTANTPNDGVGGDWPYDGLWVSIEADASGADDYMFLSAPAVSPAGIWGPTTYASANASQFRGVFKSPPFFDGGVIGGSPANSDISGTPIWADVELSQIGNIVTLKINKTVILSYTNTVTANSGNIMIGYDYAYDSIMGADSSVYIDNLRVISLAAPTLTKIVNNAGNLEITFAANPADLPAQFTLQQSSPLPTGAYADTASTITALGGGNFKAVKAAGISPTFYRIRRLY